MNSLLRISDAAAMGMHAMVMLAAAGEAPCSVSQMAERLRVSPDHLSKVMQRLVRARLVHSARGRCGGFQLAQRGEDVTLLEVFEALDGPITGRRCILPTPVCGGTACVLGRLLVDVNEEFVRALGGATLADLAAPEWLKPTAGTDAPAA